MSEHDHFCSISAEEHARLLEELRTLPTRALGRLAEPLMLPAINGDAGPASLEALRLIGEVLAERKGRAA